MNSSKLFWRRFDLLFEHFHIQSSPFFGRFWTFHRSCSSLHSLFKVQNASKTKANLEFHKSNAIKENCKTNATEITSTRHICSARHFVMQGKRFFGEWPSNPKNISIHLRSYAFAVRWARAAERPCHTTGRSLRARLYFVNFRFPTFTLHSRKKATKFSKLQARDVQNTPIEVLEYFRWSTANPCPEPSEPAWHAIFARNVSISWLRQCFTQIINGVFSAGFADNNCTCGT